METLADRIGELVSRENTESDFARKCGVSKQLLRKYLKGTMPSGDRCLAIAQAAGVSIEWLLTGVDKSSPGATRQTESMSSTHTTGTTTEIRAEDVPLRRFIDLVEDAWAIERARGWLEFEFDHLARQIESKVPELEKKSATPRSGNGAA